MRFSGLAVLVVASILAGCGGSSEDTVPVSGTVKIDGEAIAKTGYGVRFEVGGRQTVIDVESDGTFSGQSLAGKGSAWLTGGYNYPEPPTGSDPGVSLDAPPEDDQQVEYVPIEVELTSGLSMDLNFSSQ